MTLGHQTNPGYIQSGIEELPDNDSHGHGGHDHDRGEGAKGEQMSQIDEPSQVSMVRDDYTNTTGTAGRINVGGSATGSIETSGDLDWFAITLGANQSVQIAQNGNGLSDPFLRVRDANGVLLASDDDGGVGLNSLLTFTASTAGTYYIEAGAFSSTTGTYNISTRSVPTPVTPSYDPLDAITWGTQLADTTINVYFGEAGYNAGIFIPGIPAVTSEGFNAYEQARFMEAFDRIEAVTNISFTVVDTAAAADFGLTLDTNEVNSRSLGYFNTPNSTGTGTAFGVFNGSAWDRSAGGDLDVGGLGFATITHELLHGLGLAHSHDPGGTSSILAGVSGPFGSFGIHQLNQGVYTSMSYNGGLNIGAVGTEVSANGFGAEAGPMALDIAVLQQLYGANTTTATGNNVYILPTANRAGTQWESIWDAGGVDEIRHTGSIGVTIDLRAATLLGAFGGGGYLSEVNGIAGGYTIANNVVIENATGGSGADRLTGNSGNNQLEGGNGNDTVAGGGGADRLIAGNGRDTFDGGAGADTVDYAASRGSLRIDLLFSQINTNIAAGDTYTNIENLSGSQGADNLRGTFNNNLIQGQRNVDYIFGRRGADTLDGGIGNDVLFGGVDADVLRGGVNRDRAQYSESLEGLTLDLANAGRNTGEAIGDVYNSIEDLAGSGFNDLIFGDEANNQLFGREGEDQLFGRGGDDYLNGGANADRLDGGAGNDTLRGGQNTDTFVFNGGRDVIEDFNERQSDRLAIEVAVITQANGLSGSQIVSQFGSVVRGQVVFTFDNDTSIVLENVSTMAGLADNIFTF